MKTCFSRPEQLIGHAQAKVCVTDTASGEHEAPAAQACAKNQTWPEGYILGPQ